MSRNGIAWLGIFAATGLVLGACATPPPSDDPEAVADHERINDPLEPANRAIFFFNRGFDTLLLRPLAGFYGGLIPPPIREGVHNALANLQAPVILFNDLLQGETDRAWTTASRFAVNTTAGLGGLRDPATGMGYPRHEEDFGQTLATWGADEGPYLMLPLLGPSNSRDAVGIAVDFLVDPFNWWAHSTGRRAVAYARGAMRAVDLRARNDAILADLERSSLDHYAALRSLYRQRRADEIRNGGLDGPPDGPGTGRLDGPAPDPDAKVSRITDSF